MGLFGKSRAEIEREEKAKAEAEAEAEAAAARAARIRSWGWKGTDDDFHLRALGQLTAASPQAAFCYEFFGGSIVDIETARKNPEFPSFLFRALTTGFKEGDRDFAFLGEHEEANISAAFRGRNHPPAYDFTYPAKFSWVAKSSAAIAQRYPFSKKGFFYHDRMAQLSALACLKHLDTTANQQCKALVLDVARQCPTAFDLCFWVCFDNEWLIDLEAIVRAQNRLVDTAKVLLAENKDGALVDWFKTNHKFCECVFVLEKMGRLKEAADLLEKLGASSYFDEFESDGTPIKWDGKKEQEEAFDLKLSQLRAYAAVATPAGATRNKTLSVEDLEDKFTYGEISKAEYERLKAKAAPAKTCGSCGKPVQPDFAFCPHCGSKA